MPSLRRPRPLCLLSRLRRSSLVRRRRLLLATFWDFWRGELSCPQGESDHDALLCFWLCLQTGKCVWHWSSICSLCFTLLILLLCIRLLGLPFRPRPSFYLPFALLRPPVPMSWPPTRPLARAWRVSEVAAYGRSAEEAFTMARPERRVQVAMGQTVSGPAKGRPRIFSHRPTKWGGVLTDERSRRNGPGPARRKKSQDPGGARAPVLKATRTGGAHLVLLEILRGRLEIGKAQGQGAQVWGCSPSKARNPH